MKKIINKIFIISMLFMMATVAFKGISRIADASGNTTDTYWRVNLKASSNFAYTEARGKYDDSKVYLNWVTKGGVNKMYVAPYGLRKINGAHYNCTDYTGSTRKYTVYNVGKYAMTNYVCELGYDYAAIGFMSRSGSGYPSGYWSPDCAGSYKVLN